MEGYKIIGILKPFEVIQNLYVFKDGEEVEKLESKVETFNDDIFALSEKYNIVNVDLTGPKTYTRGVIRSIQKAEIAKYSKNNLVIHNI